MVAFFKMQALGNDFVVIFENEKLPENREAFSKQISNRYLGVGCDQVIFIKRDDIPCVSFYNSDGTRAEMCGNGLRSAAWLLFQERKLSRIRTDAGLHQVSLKADLVTVNLGKPKFSCKDWNFSLERVVKERVCDRFDITLVSMGNPHCVLFTDDLSNADLKGIGDSLLGAGFFPNGINIELVQIMSRDKLKIRVLERGAGETKACGSGAAASIVAGVLTGQTERIAEVIMPGGAVEVCWNDKDEVLQTGHCELVFKGEFYQTV